MLQHTSPRGPCNLSASQAQLSHKPSIAAVIRGRGGLRRGLAGDGHGPEAPPSRSSVPCQPAPAQLLGGASLSASMSSLPTRVKLLAGAPPPRASTDLAVAVSAAGAAANAVTAVSPPGSVVPPSTPTPEEATRFSSPPAWVGTGRPQLQTAGHARTQSIPAPTTRHTIGGASPTACMREIASVMSTRPPQPHSAGNSLTASAAANPMVAYDPQMVSGLAAAAAAVVAASRPMSPPPASRPLVLPASRRNSLGSAGGSPQPSAGRLSAPPCSARGTSMGQPAISEDSWRALAASAQRLALQSAELEIISSKVRMRKAAKEASASCEPVDESACNADPLPDGENTAPAPEEEATETAAVKTNTAVRCGMPTCPRSALVLHRALQHALRDSGVAPGEAVPTGPAARPIALRRTREYLQGCCQAEKPDEPVHEIEDDSPKSAVMDNYVALAALVWQLVGGDGVDGVEATALKRGGG
eukprot:gnl/TRDRNA2_/TRDRNA2_186171_c0_seq1.p1 gnl/TRDRNA2_/TRDRNA2_186171_c0~~gnl/TRDRNA2_/TRDRNA2_186171_c0_seq1.p1  ORF type:complete len:499 (+),score=59.32 gnl/TRDRNA2_/TRDRNA2_186171_c0_seq1:79-1497(+)